MTKPTQQEKRKSNNPNLAEDSKATQWVKGQSGNPKGSPKKPASITMHLRDELAKIGRNGKTKAQEIAEGMVEASLSPVAASGSPRVLSEVLDRTEGKVTQPIGGDPKQPVIIKVEYESDATK